MALRGSGARVVQWLGLTLLAAVTAVLCYLALTQDTAADSELARDESPSATETTPTQGPSATEQPSPGADVKVPKVPLQRLADLTKGDDLPDGAVVYDSPNNASRMRITDAGLTHGAVRDGATAGLGLVETELESDVEALGLRVRFPEGKSGSAAVSAWEASAVTALDNGAEALPSGLRLAVGPGSWTLSAVSAGGEETLAEGTFLVEAAPVELSLVRDGDDLYVVDPTGAVTTATKIGAARLVGRFASWGLFEPGPEAAPAVIESVWAG